MPTHPALVPPTKGSEFYQMVITMRKFHEQMAADCQTIAAAIRSSLPRAKGKNLAPLRLDLKIYARLVARVFAHIAALNLAIAKTYTIAYNTYARYFVNGTTATNRAPFDVDA